MSDYEEGTAGRALTIFLMLLATAGALYLILSRHNVTDEDATRAARTWADTMGVRVTGLRCDGSRCEVMPEHGAPIVLRCGTACRMEVCQ